MKSNIYDRIDQRLQEILNQNVFTERYRTNITTTTRVYDFLATAPHHRKSPGPVDSPPSGPFSQVRIAVA